MAIDLTVVIDEKEAVNRFRRLRKEAADSVSGMSKEFDKIDSTVDDFAESIALSKKYIEELKRKYQEVSAALSKAPLGSKERAVLGMELRNINNELKDEEKAIRDAEIALKSQERAYASLTVISGSKIESLKAIHNQKAIGQGCKAIVIDLDKDMHRLNEKRLGTHIQWRHTDFEKGTVERCYVIYDGKAVLITKKEIR